MNLPFHNHDTHHEDIQVEMHLPRVALEIAEGESARKFRPIEGPALLIGSAADSDLVLADPSFPAAHSYLLRTIEGVALVYLGRGPQVYIAGQPVRRRYLANGDLVQMGPFQFKIHVQWATAPVTPQPSSTKLRDMFDIGPGEFNLVTVSDDDNVSKVNVRRPSVGLLRQGTVPRPWLHRSRFRFAS